MQWIKLTDRIPNPDEHGRVLIYTDGHNFNGEQVFDVEAETLNERFKELCAWRGAFVQRNGLAYDQKRDAVMHMDTRKGYQRKPMPSNKA